MSEMDKERITEIDNRSRSNQSRIEDHDEALQAISEGLMGLQKTLQQLFLTSLSSQIMEETITRYLAGYEPGDYTKEVEMAQNEGVKSPADFKLLVKDPNFDQERFNKLAEEIGRVMINARAQALQKHKESGASPIAGPDGKPILKVVR